MASGRREEDYKQAADRFLQNRERMNSSANKLTRPKLTKGVCEVKSGEHLYANRKTRNKLLEEVGITESTWNVRMILSQKILVMSNVFQNRGWAALPYSITEPWIFIRGQLWRWKDRQEMYVLRYASFCWWKNKNGLLPSPVSQLATNTENPESRLHQKYPPSFSDFLRPRI